MVMHKNLPGVLHAARADRYVARVHLNSIGPKWPGYRAGPQWA
jgi:hypothetical protein